MKIEEFKHHIENYGLNIDSEGSFVFKLIKLAEAVKFAEESTWFGEFEERYYEVTLAFEELEKE